ncbi:amidase family protein [Rhodococcus sp. NPDC058514]|uniref:amidase family protein n=1 Tax=unclassified Rhodococcus (in: high G+C Gram-positive bacteria) TaxID=192944 RepID=UPI003649F105
MVDPTLWREHGTPLVESTGHGPLDGMTVAVKDLFDVAGHPVGAGNEQWLAQSRSATATAPAVAALLAAGAAIAGIARTDEFAYSLAGTNAHYGTPPNPRAPDRIPGGSSSGPAAAVALGEAAVGLGTDTGGSIRVPASYQGLYGIRPTHGVVAAGGVLPLAPSFDTVGWVTREPQTLFAVGQVLLPAGGDRGFSRAIVSDEVLGLGSRRVREAIGAALADWGGGDLPPIHRTSFDTGVLPGWADVFRTVQGWEAWRAHGAWIERHWDGLGPDIRARFEAASGYTDGQRERAVARMRQIRGEIDRWLGDDLLLLPSASSVAPTRTDATLGGPAIERARAATLELTGIAGLSGRCAVSVPLPTADGVPVGLCIVAPRGRDLELLRLVRGFAARARVSPQLG